MNDFREQVIRVHDTDKMPILLVGNKSDMESEREVTREEAQALAAKVWEMLKGLFFFFFFFFSLLWPAPDFIFRFCSASGVSSIWRRRPRRAPTSTR